MGQVNQHFMAYQSISNDQLRSKTQEFKQRIAAHLGDIDKEITDLNTKGEELPFSDINGKDTIYTEIDRLKKERDKQIEAILKDLLPEAFAVVKETARRFKENTEIVATATELDRELSISKKSISGSTVTMLFIKIVGRRLADSSPGTCCTMMCS